MTPIEKWFPLIGLAAMFLLGSLGFPRFVVIDATLRNVVIGAVISAVVSLGTAGWAARRELRRDERARTEARKSSAAVVAAQLSSILGYQEAVARVACENLRMKSPSGADLEPWQGLLPFIGAAPVAHVDARDLAFLVLAGRGDVLGEVVAARDLAAGLADVVQQYSDDRKRLVSSLPSFPTSDDDRVLEFTESMRRLRPQMDVLNMLAMDVAANAINDTLATLAAIRRFRAACRQVFADPDFLPMDDGSLGAYEKRMNALKVERKKAFAKWVAARGRSEQPQNNS